MFNLLLILLHIISFPHYDRRKELLTYSHLSQIRTELPAREMRSLWRAGLAGESSAWPQTDRQKEVLYKCLHHLQLHRATCDTVNYIFSRFTNKQLKDTCFCFCQCISRKTGNESDWNNKPWEETRWNFLVLQKIPSFLKWQELQCTIWSKNHSFNR